MTTKCLKRVKNLERYTFLFYFTTFLLVSFAIKKIVRRIRNEGMIVDNLYIFFTSTSKLFIDYASEEEEAKKVYLYNRNYDLLK